MCSVEVWWVDGWDEGREEPVQEAAKLASFASLAKAVAFTRKEKVHRRARRKFGPGEIVILNEDGCRVSRRLPLRRPEGVA